MSRNNKLQRFKEIKDFANVIEPSWEDGYNGCFEMKGKWHKQFGNKGPITIELGCGKGEYTIALAERFPDRNFVGVDIKGARMWRGALTALEKKLGNVCFLRSRIEFIETFFGKDEVEEIWLTFPDPQLRKSRSKKRLTSPQFLSRYNNILSPKGSVHLKTDSVELYDYTLEVISQEGYSLLGQSSDLYDNSNGKFEIEDEGILTTKTYYEDLYLNEGKKITYLNFRLN